MKKSIYTHNLSETKEVGILMAPNFRPGDVVLLRGDLGAGKTSLVSGVASGLGISEQVLSPTFNIMKCYFDGSLPLYHIDAYRLENQHVEIGLDEYIEGDGVCFIEWPDNIAVLLPDEFLEITIHNLGNDDRELILSANSPRFDWAFKEY